MKVLVTGATGLVGTHLVRKLVSERHSVIVLARTPEKARTLFDTSVSVYPLEGWERVDAVDAIINLAGEPIANGRWTAERKRRIFESRVEGTRRLVQSICDREGQMPKVFISTSAVGIYGNAGEEMLTEESGTGNDFLAEVCKSWEAQARRAEEYGVRTVILRLGMVLSKDGGALGKMLPFFQRGMGGPLGNGTQWVSWIHIDDLVSLILWALQESALSGVCNAVSPQPVRNADFVTTLSAVLGKHNFFRVPAFALRLALGEMSTVLLSSQRVVSKKLENTRFVFRYSDIKSAVEQTVRNR